jgi:hypothetical protein
LENIMRRRMTWNDRGARQNRRASEHPAYPDEGPASPAYQPDKGADAYDIGGPSEFAEDPHPGPYSNSSHPAYPDEGPASPAYKAAALERKAAKCIRIATSMLGKHASVDSIEDQALALMDLTDRQIRASLARIAEEEASEDEEMEEMEESKKKASRRRASSRRRAPARRRAPSRRNRRAGYHMDEESMLDQMMMEEMLEEEGMMGKHSEESMLDAMLVEEGMMDKDSRAGWGSLGVSPTSDRDFGDRDSQTKAYRDLYNEEYYQKVTKKAEDEMLAEMLEEEGMSHDPMGGEMMDEAMADSEMMADPMGMDEMIVEGDEMVMLAKLFNAADEKEEKAAETIQEEVEHKAEEKEESKKKASLRPQPKRAATGATRLGGGVSKTASSEINELSNLWESAPDVSKFF